VSVTKLSAGDGQMKRPRSNAWRTGTCLGHRVPQNLDQPTASAPEDEQVAAVRLALELLLHKERQSCTRSASPLTWRAWGEVLFDARAGFCKASP